MKGKHADPFLMDFWRAVSEAKLQEMQKLHRLSGDKGELVDRLSKMPGMVSALLCMSSFELPELQALAASINASNIGTTAISLGNAILARLRKHQRQQRLGPRLSEFQAFWSRASGFSREITLLRSTPKLQNGEEPLGFFNPEVGAEGPWLTVDLQHHPDPAIVSPKTLLVTSNDGVSGSVEELTSFACPEGWIPLFPYPSAEMPSIELLKILAPEHFVFPEDGEILQAYDSEIWESSLVSGIHLFGTSAARPYDDIYAQLGGFPHAWPEGNEAWEMQSPLILRTYANSEPWIEVYLENGSYRVFQRIT